MVHKNEAPAGGDGRGSRNVDQAGGLIASENNIADSDNQHDASHYAYVDALQIWLEHPLSKKELKWLAGECGNHFEKPPFRRDKRPYWNRDYRQGLRLTQPSRVALEWLAKRDDILITYAEIAFDYICDDDSNQWLTRTFSENFVQPWHGKRRTQIFENQRNGRTARRGQRGSSWQWYDDKPSKVTDEDCFHLEIRIQGGAASRRSGIDCVADLLDFDYTGFLHRHVNKKRFLTVDHERLGRFHENKRLGTRRRRPNIRMYRRSFAFNVDGAIGSTLYTVHAGHPESEHYSVQQLVDTYGRGPFLTPFLCYVQTTVTQSDEGEGGNCVEDGKRYHLRRYLESIDSVTLDFPISEGEKS